LMSLDLGRNNITFTMNGGINPRLQITVTESGTEEIGARLIAPLRNFPF